MNKQLMSKLVKIADRLDKAGQYSAASMIDDLLIEQTSWQTFVRKAVLETDEELEIEIPEEERAMLEEVLFSLKRSLE